LCCQTNSKISDTDRFKFQSDQHYLKTAQEMRRLFQHVPDACDNTLLINDRVNISIDFDSLHLPVFAVPTGFKDASAYLAHMSAKGLTKRYGTPTAEQQERLAYELGVLEALGLSSYMLIVWDICRWADQQGIRRGAARGSVAGSLVAYCMNISKVDPIRHGLIFERFLNPSRVAMPDIDLDWDSRYRDQVINYTREKYGEDHVAQIITFSIIRARAAVRDSARVLGIDPIVADKVSKAMPPALMGEPTPLYACMDYTERYAFGYKNAVDLRAMYHDDPEVKQIIDVALGLEGLHRQDGIHPAGLVIADKPITEYVPIQRRGADAPIVTQYEKNTIEALGLLKMDYLGLKNLDVITETINLIGSDPGVENTEFNDLSTFDMLKHGGTIGVFQLESKPMRQLLQRLQPNSIDDIAAVVALYRPGPMGSNMHNDYADRKNHRQPVSYFHSDAEDILGQTYGLCVEENQRVWTETGPVAIKHLSPGDVVYGESGQPSKVSRVVATGDKRVYKVIVNKRELLCSGDHKFLTPNGYVEARNLNGEMVALAPALQEHGKVNDIYAARLLAALLSDGQLNGSQIQVCKNDDDYLTGVEDAVSRLFPDMTSSRKFRTRAWYSCFKRAAGVKHLATDPTSLRLWVRNLGLDQTHSHTKFIPSVVWSWDEDTKKEFIAWYFSGDGHVSPGAITCTLRTISEQVATGLHDVLLSLGAFSHVGADGDAFTVFVQDKSFMDDIMHRIVPSKRQHIQGYSDYGLAPFGVREAWLRSGLTQREFAERYGVGRSTIRSATPDRCKRSVAEKLGYRSPHRWMEASVVRTDTRANMYDIEVAADHHSFVVEGLIAHNCIYQEQVMKLAQRFAGYSMVEADGLRKIIGKKLIDKMVEEKDKFIQGCTDEGYNAELGSSLFHMIEHHASYSFNKSHAYGYGYISYQTAFLKANYPKEYLASLCTVFSDELDKCALFLNELRDMGFSVKTPDINLSEIGFSVKGDSVMVGLGAIRNIGPAKAEKILAAREEGGRFTSVVDMAKRVNPNSSELEAYAYSGALDDFGSRFGLATIASDVLKAVRKDSKKQVKGQDSLFDTEPLWSFEVPNQELPRRTELEYEHNALGLYISGHPLEDHMEHVTDWSIVELDQVPDNERVPLLIIAADITVKRTRAGALMAILTAGDHTGNREVLMFPRTYEEHKDSIHIGEVGILYVRTGRDRAGDQNLVFQRFEKIEVAEQVVSQHEFSLFLPEGFAQQDAYVAKLKGVLLSHHGDRPVNLHIGRSSTLKLPHDILVEYTPDLIKDIGNLFKEYSSR
jgi:DNA polymerase-3 subunit alpha